MRFVDLNQKEVLNNFIVQEGRSNFLQSWEWGEFQKSNGLQVRRVGILEGNELWVVASLIKRPFWGGQSYFYCPRGPILKEGKGDANPLFLAKILELTQKEKVIFWRFDFPGSSLPPFFPGAIKKAPCNVQPRCTLILDLRQNEADLLAGMKAKTRYNIRLALRKGITLSEGFAPKDVEEFWHLARVTAARAGFRSHRKEYYQNMAKILGGTGFLRVFLAHYKSEVIAANLVVFFGSRATYLHGASSDQYRNVMAPYFLQWQQILRAKERGYTEYDFWGIAPPSDPLLGKKWAGITRFKRGFGGKEVCYAGTFDLPLRPSLYRLYCFARRFSR